MTFAILQTAQLPALKARSAYIQNPVLLAPLLVSILASAAVDWLALRQRLRARSQRLSEGSTHAGQECQGTCAGLPSHSFQHCLAFRLSERSKPLYQTLLQVRVPKAFLEASGSPKKVPPSPKKGIKTAVQGDVLIATLSMPLVQTADTSSSGLRPGSCMQAPHC